MQKRFSHKRLWILLLISNQTITCSSLFVTSNVDTNLCINNKDSLLVRWNSFKTDKSLRSTMKHVSSFKSVEARSALRWASASVMSDASSLCVSWWGHSSVLNDVKSGVWTYDADWMSLPLVQYDDDIIKPPSCERRVFESGCSVWNKRHSPVRFDHM